MKNFLQLIVLLLITGGITAQDSFSDDFESYEVGAFVGSESAQWSTWSGATGGAEDAPVTDETAASGSKSIAFVGAAGGGPQDVILPFGGRRSSGTFTYSMNMYIPEANNGYFNFQGETTPGRTWVLNAQFRANGNLQIDFDGMNVVVSALYPKDQWFNVEVDVNLTSNLWKVNIDGVCVGSFENSNNFLASIDLFPIDNNSVFFVDDVDYLYDTEAETIDYAFDAGLVSAIDGVIGFAGADKAVGATVSNNGTEVITSFSITSTPGGIVDFDNVDLAQGDEMTVELGTIGLESGDNLINIALSSINGESIDDNGCNNIQAIALIGIVPAENKKVLIEEATGTWCQFCPRGDVFMNRLSERYGDRFVSIAVHNDDPMVVSEWDSGVTSLPGFDGFPNAYVNRATIVDPSGLEDPFITSVQVKPIVFLEHGALFDETTRELKVDIFTNFTFPIGGDLRLFVGLTEDGVTGTSAGYAQSNAFSGLDVDMAGYESLPNPVPATDMVYNHVSRHMFTEFNGLEGAYEDATIGIGTVATNRFTFVVPGDFNVKNMHIVSAFRNGSGIIENANISTIEEAEVVGLSSNEIDVTLDTGISIYPNPISDITNISMSFDEPTDVTMEVTNAIGQLVAQRNYGTVSGKKVFTLNATSLDNGIYYIKLMDGEKFTTKRVVVSH